MTEAGDLLPCPFCGCEQIAIAPALMFDADEMWNVICKACGAEVWGDDEEQAVRHWQARIGNTRAPITPSVDKLVEALRPFARAAEHYVHDHDDNEIRLPRSYAAGKDDFAPLLHGRDFRRARTTLSTYAGEEA